MSRTKTRCQFYLQKQDFFLTNFFVLFCFVLSWLFRKPRNEHFLLRNNGNHSESIPRNCFGTKFLCQPYSPMNSFHSSFSHDLSPPFLFPHFSVLFHLVSPFFCNFIPVPSSLTHLRSSLSPSLTPLHLSDYPSLFNTILLSLSHHLWFITLFPYPCPCLAA